MGCMRHPVSKPHWPGDWRDNWRHRPWVEAAHPLHGQLVGVALATRQMGMVVPGEAAEQLTVVIYMLSVVSVRHGRDSALAHTARMHARQS